MFRLKRQHWSQLNSLAAIRTALENRSSTRSKSWRCWGPSLTQPALKRLPALKTVRASGANPPHRRSCCWDNCARHLCASCFWTHSAALRATCSWTWTAWCRLNSCRSGYRYRPDWWTSFWLDIICSFHALTLTLLSCVIMSSNRTFSGVLALNHLFIVCVNPRNCCLPSWNSTFFRVTSLLSNALCSTHTCLLMNKGYIMTFE